MLVKINDEQDLNFSLEYSFRQKWVSSSRSLIQVNPDVIKIELSQKSESKKAMKPFQ